MKTSPTSAAAPASCRVSARSRSRARTQGARPQERRGGALGLSPTRHPDRERPVRRGRVVPDGDAPRPGRIVIHPDQVEALAAPGASPATEIDTCLGRGAQGRLREPLLGAQIARREGPFHREHVQRPTRRGPGFRIEPEDCNPRAQRRHSSLGHAPASSRLGVVSEDDGTNLPNCATWSCVFPLPDLAERVPPRPRRVGLLAAGTVQLTGGFGLSLISGAAQDSRPADRHPSAPERRGVHLPSAMSVPDDGVRDRQSQP